MTRKRTSDPDFVLAYLSSATDTECAEKLGVSQPSVHVRAARLRRLGVNLPKHNAVDVVGLNNLIKKSVKS